MRIVTEKSDQGGFSLLELIAVTAILGVLATLVVARVSSYNEGSKAGACYVNKGDIEIQAELWQHNTGSWPASDLSDIGADGNYFPEGVSSCPVDGTAYAIDASTGLVIGHNH